MKHICDTAGINLVFPDDDLHKQYKEALERLQVQTYKSIRDKYGVFASNQNAFVESVEQFNNMDSTHMEKLYKKYYLE